MPDTTLILYIAQDKNTVVLQYTVHQFINSIIWECDIIYLFIIEKPRNTSNTLQTTNGPGE